ncbi:MAG: tRNA (adenosine(37)-N6)-threonylcarbamoyltransferase complex ATPase subunit type 1 TsaE [Chitinophagaceae bacterium]|nr:tRNA (adenosine(37)-N6)-threonylcarbamoyltransferase complex ATPase subunit type 1 TsaE [Chitinophagaceae bacterium]
MEFDLYLEKTDEAAAMFWQQVKGNVFAFHGQMGAGKTTFISALCRAKGVTGHIGSPTFSLINEYRYTEEGNTRSIFHIDLYRLTNEEEALNAGVEDCLYSGDICFVEWPEKVPALLPEDTVHVYVHPVSNHIRRLKIEVGR